MPESEETLPPSTVHHLIAASEEVLENEEISHATPLLRHHISPTPKFIDIFKMCPPSSLVSRAQSDHDHVSSRDQPINIPSLVPSDPISQSAYTHAILKLHPTILSHSLRVYLHAQRISSQESLPWHTDTSLIRLLFTACIFHDIGTSPAYNTGPTRFEIEGADAAVNFLLTAEDNSITPDQAHAVWTAIAIHDTPQIAERIHPLARLVRLGVTIDFKRPAALAMVSEAWVEEVEGRFPRGAIEKVLGDEVVAQALECPEKAPPACWPGGLLRAKWAEPEWEGVNKAF